MNTHIIDKIRNTFNLYRIYGNNDYIGESISQLEHALQCAHNAELYYSKNESDPNLIKELILGAFLHDIGHLIFLDNKKRNLTSNNNNSMNGLGLEDHETIGSNYLLNNTFTERISDMAKYHVLSKRYLVSKYENYYNNLSDASKQTLVLQGGKLNNNEILDFEKNKNFNYCILMRNWDDQSKQTNFKYFKGIDYYETIAIKLLVK